MSTRKSDFSANHNTHGIDILAFFGFLFVPGKPSQIDNLLLSIYNMKSTAQKKMRIVIYVFFAIEPTSPRLLNHT